MPRRDQTDAALPPRWEPCAPGEIARLGKRLRIRKSRRVFLRSGMTAVASILAGGGVVWLARGRQREEEYDYGGITCSAVDPLAMDYLAGKVPEPTKSKIAKHIARCPECGPRFQEMRETLKHG